MVIYEVNLTVEPGIASAFRDWLPGHMREILQLDGFLSAEWFEITNLQWAIQYRLKDQISLDNYFKNHAPRLRQDGLDRFGSQFQASRRVMTLVESL